MMPAEYLVSCRKRPDLLIPDLTTRLGMELMITHPPRLLVFLHALIFLFSPAVPAADSGNALLRAIADQQPQRVAILLDQGVSPEATTATGEFQGKTALMWAAETGQTEILELLLDYGATVDRTNPKGGTALMYAAVAGQTEAIRLLAEAGADPNHRVRHGWTPLMLATSKGHSTSVRTLVELGADPMTRDVYGSTLLMRATELGNLEMVRTLLGLGLKPETENNSGASALQIAQRRNNEELLRLLRRHAGRS